MQSCGNGTTVPEFKNPIEFRKPVSKSQRFRLPEPKTLFIVLDSGTAIRNILRTDVIQVLRNCENLRIVVFSPIADGEFKKEIESKNVIVEHAVKWKPPGMVKLLRSLKKDIWAEKHELVRFKEKRQARKSQLLRKMVLGLMATRGNPEAIDNAVRKLEKWEARFTPLLAKEHFDKYKPDLVFCTTLYAKDLCVELGAKQRKIPNVAFILSWDNPTTKGPFPVKPDRAIVWNGIMRNELMEYHDFRPEQVFVSGPPQFDIYTDHSKFISREEFFKRWGLDPAKKLITYTTGSSGMLPFEDEMVEIIQTKIKSGAFRQPCQLLARLHPKDKYEPYQRFENTPGLVLQLPGRKGNTNDSWNPTREDMYGLAETLHYSDVVVNIASTITIDAAALDTPVVNAAFDGFSDKPYEKSCRRYYDFNHYKNVVKTGGLKISQNAEELVQHIQSYLDDPSQEREGRARIREEQCHKLDGKCGERIALYLLESLQKPA
jgi:hypothetical protein